MKFAFAGLMVVWAFVSSGQFLNPIVDQQNEGTFNHVAQLTNQKLIYQTKKNQQIHLWSMDLNTHAKEIIHSVTEPQTIRRVLVMDDQIFFTSPSETWDDHLWRSDGTAANTQRVSEISLDRYGPQIIQNQLFALNEQQELLLYSGGRLENLGVQSSSIQLTCVFGDDDYLFQTQGDTEGEYRLSRYRSGEVTSVYEYTPRNNFQTRVQYFQDSCYFRHLIEGGTAIIRVTKQGAIESFSPDIPDHRLYDVYSHQGRLYAITGEEGVSNKIHRLTADLRAADNSIAVSNQFYFGGIQSVNQLIVTTVTQNQFEPWSQLAILDSALNPIPHHYSPFQNIADGAHAVGSEVWLGLDSIYEEAVIERFNQNNELEAVSIKGHAFSRLVSHPNHEQVFLRLTNKTTGIPNLYTLTDQPLINDQISGGWFEPDIMNQGIVIQKGQRHDGSNYVFATVYGIDGGRPIWLAGGSNYTALQSKLDIDLYQYDGLNLLEIDRPSNEVAFGKLQIEMQTCDRMWVNIESESNNHSLNLYRIDDHSFKHMCADVQPLDLTPENQQPFVQGGTHE